MRNNALYLINIAIPAITIVIFCLSAIMKSISFITLEQSDPFRWVKVIIYIFSVILLISPQILLLILRKRLINKPELNLFIMIINIIFLTQSDVVHLFLF